MNPSGQDRAAVYAKLTGEMFCMSIEQVANLSDYQIERIYAYQESPGMTSEEFARKYNAPT